MNAIPHVNRLRTRQYSLVSSLYGQVTPQLWYVGKQLERQTCWRTYEKVDGYSNLCSWLWITGVLLTMKASGVSINYGTSEGGISASTGSRETSNTGAVPKRTDEQDAGHSFRR